MKNLRIYLRAIDISEHPQKMMKRLVISYTLAVPQSLYDSWEFYHCKNVPDELPDCFSRFQLGDYCYGYGLSHEDVKLLNEELIEFGEDGQ